MISSRDEMICAAAGKVGTLDRTRHGLCVVRGLERLRAGFGDFLQVVRRDFRRHAHRDAGSAVQQHHRQARGQELRLAHRAVVVVGEIHRAAVELGEQHVLREGRESHLGVAVGRGRIAVARAEVALAVDQRIAQREVLGHAHRGVVHRAVAVRMVLADDVAHHARALLVRRIGAVAHLAHGEEDAALHRFLAVLHGGERAPLHHAHRVGEVGLLGEAREARRLRGGRARRLGDEQVARAIVGRGLFPLQGKRGVAEGDVILAR